MNITLRISLFLALILYFGCIIALLKKKQLTLKYTLLWLLGGVLMAFIAAFPGLFEKLTQMIGVVDMYNGLFAIIIFVLIIILISITSIVSGLNDRLRRLTQMCAMYEKRIRDLEKQVEDIE